MNGAARKPLGGKGYGSTPHLPGSRVGPGDWHIHEGQARILTEKTRDRHDRVIVTEKLDGSCVTVANISGEIVPVTRAGYHAKDSPFRMHHLFADWVEERSARFAEIIADGERVVGEWLAQAHGTRYVLDGRDALFVAFAIMQGKKRLTHDETRERLASAGLVGAAVISDGPALSVEAALSSLGPLGRHGAIDEVEGAVWVCERKGVFDFIAKHVKAEKIDGKYLHVVTGGEDVWNEVKGWKPE